MSEVFDSRLVTGGLKDFQRLTVDYVFSRLFDAANPAARFLVADEVGLGKTLVAKGVIAKAVEHLQRQGQKQVNVVYICSNSGIAAQNVKRLSLPGQSAYVESTRLSLLPLKTVQLKEHPVSFISFTPGTTFNDGPGYGHRDERTLIYQMLRDLAGIDRAGFQRAMKGAVGQESWFNDSDQPREYDEQIAQEFRNSICTNQPLVDRLGVVSHRFAEERPDCDKERDGLARRLIGDLRRLLARVCLNTLRPDLVILDEFQRFRDLFADPDENPAAELAKALFEHAAGTRLLLLSATPYKMYASHQEDEDHHSDFLHTVQFLMRGDASSLSALQTDLRDFRTELLSVSESRVQRLDYLKRKIEDALSSVMCRTERVGMTHLANAMVQERRMVPELKARDLRDFRWLEAVAERLAESGTIEYWKSSPYLLNFMKDYRFKKLIEGDQERAVSSIGDLLEDEDDRLLSAQSIDSYKPVDAGNPRLRALISEIESQGLWRILWMPASMPYWRPEGAYENVGSVTKHLIFSAWNVVPDAIASILSYEVERKLIEHSGTVQGYGHKATRRLRFSRQADGRPGGMFALMLMFPSLSLVHTINPLQQLKDMGAGNCSFKEIRELAAAKLEPLLAPIVAGAKTDGTVDRRWYWIALARLECIYAPANARAWCARAWSNARGGTASDAGDVEQGQEDHHRNAFSDHTQVWLQAWDGALDGLGAVPPDLAKVLATVALAGPATCALRSLIRQWPLDAVAGESLLNAAAHIAEGMRSQFNSPRAAWLLASKEEDEFYWERVLHYCADGNLQSILDEHSHVLFESLGSPSNNPEDALKALSQAMFDAMSLRTASLHPDRLRLEGKRLKIDPFPTGIRTHFALRYGARTDDEGSNVRKESVQAAFNSPFWPFVLVSTSVGQEGLDFHTWCHSVIHWNLPSNPVDLEQREGRVHRYKGYAVRKNVAAQHGKDMLADSACKEGDPWTRMFFTAAAGREEASNDLVPYWIYDTPSGASIERRVMLLPLSRDEAKYQRLRRSLALYRLVFAQPRQEDLLAYLETSIGADQAAVVAARWAINLAPKMLSDRPLGAAGAFVAKTNQNISLQGRTSPQTALTSLAIQVSVHGGSEAAP